MILVVGATGYVGRYLCVYLKEQGYDVLALGRSKQVQNSQNVSPVFHTLPSSRSGGNIPVLR